MDFKNLTRGLHLNFLFHERKQSARVYCMLKTDQLLVSHEKDFTIQLISDVKKSNGFEAGLTHFNGQNVITENTLVALH